MVNKAIKPLTTTDADVLEDLDDIEHMAVELATLAGAESLRPIAAFSPCATKPARRVR